MDEVSQLMDKPSVSIVIITKNEEDKIASCLESVKWASEVIIVDDMSTDKTVEICKSFGARVIRNESKGNFDNQRNIGIDNSRGEWVLQMDADEIITDKVKEKILKTLKNPGEFVAYKFRRKNFFLGHFMKYGGWYGYMTKLFKKDCARYIGKSVHETLKVDGRVGIIEADIEHYPFMSISELIERANDYASVEARVMREEKNVFKERVITYNLIIRPLKLFWKSYVKRRGFKDGMYGLIYALLNSWGHFLRWAKYWELIREKMTQ
jgi:glycosyltransferase involved in cell wall biosynthesis